MRHLTRFRRVSVPGGRRDETPDTLSQRYRGKWETGRCHLERFRGDSVPGGRQEVLPGTLSQENRGRWEAGRCHLEHFRKDTVAGGRQEVLPGTLSREFRARWTAGRCHLERFCRNSVPGGRQEVPPGTLLRGFRARWTAGSDTWNAFAGIPCQVEAGRCHLERFRGDSVPGGSREMPPGTLSRRFRTRWVTYQQGHTVALRRSFPQCGPLPFSGADAGFGLCMSLSSRIILT